MKLSLNIIVLITVCLIFTSCQNNKVVIGKPPQEVLNIATQQLKDGKHSEALKTLDEAIDQNPDDAGLRHARGVVKIEQLNFDGALADLEQSVALDPKQSIYYSDLAFLYNRLKKPEEAIKAADNAIRLDPNSSAGYLVKSLVYEQMDKFDEALINVNKSLDIYNGSTMARLERSRILSNLKRYSEAISDLNYCITQQPDSPEPYYDLAKILEIMKKNKEAAKNYEKYVSLVSENKKYSEVYSDFLSDAKKQLKKLKQND